MGKGQSSFRMHHKTYDVCTLISGSLAYGITNKGLAVCISNLLLMIPQNSCFDWSLILWTSGSARLAMELQTVCCIFPDAESAHIKTKTCLGKINDTGDAPEVLHIITKLLQLHDSENNKSL